MLSSPFEGAGSNPATVGFFLFALHILCIISHSYSQVYRMNSFTVIHSTPCLIWDCVTNVVVIRKLDL